MKISSAKRRPFCPGGDELKMIGVISIHKWLIYSLVMHDMRCCLKEYHHAKQRFYEVSHTNAIARSRVMQLFHVTSFPLIFLADSICSVDVGTPKKNN